MPLPNQSAASLTAGTGSRVCEDLIPIVAVPAPMGCLSNSCRKIFEAFVCAKIERLT